MAASNASPEIVVSPFWALIVSGARASVTAGRMWPLTTTS
jgi:hypothetical protein